MASGTSTAPGPKGWALAALLGAYPVAWLLLQELSTPMAFWPVALRFLLLWWLPLRHWPWVAAVDIGAGMVARQVFEDEPLFGPGQLLIAAAPVLLYIAVIGAIRAFRGARGDGEPDRPRRMALLLLACTASAFAVAPFLVVYLATFRGMAVDGLGAVLRFGFGDLFGLMAVVPLAIAIRTDGFALWRSRRWLFEGALGLAVSVGMTTLARHHPGIDEHLLLLGFLPMVILAFRHGWVGAAWSVGTLGLLLALGVAGHDNLLRLQVMTAVIGGSALLLGAAASELRAQREMVEAQHASLRLAMLEHRELAGRIVALEDEGLRHVADSLHEQVSPPLQELRTLLAMAWRSGGGERDARMLETLRGHTWQVQDGIERALRRLQPPALARGDLRAVLADGALWEWAQEQGATWSAELYGPVQAMPERWKVLLYRMAQAGLEQGLARGGSDFSLRIAVHADAGAMDIDWTLEVAQPAGRDPDRRVLNAVHDRALAAGGHYRCEPTPGGSRHRVRFDGVLTAPG
jgi:glucose-6-phosphate-specific signal transduction histidine kinase